MDSVFDLARVMRVPGTWNRKAEPHVRVSLRSVCSTRYSTDVVDGHCVDDWVLTELGQPDGSNAVELLELRPDASPDIDKFQALSANVPAFAASWSYNRPDLQDQTPSGYDMSLAKIAANAGWPDQEIANLLIAWRREHGLEPKVDSIGRLRQDYYSGTIRRARAGRCATRTDGDRMTDRSRGAMASSGKAGSAASTSSLGSARVWPSAIDDVAYHGLAGRFVALVTPHSEADRVALLVQFLAAFGCAVGRRAYFQVEGDQHYPNLFVTLVGATSKPRSTD